MYQLDGHIGCAVAGITGEMREQRTKERIALKKKKLMPSKTPIAPPFSLLASLTLERQKKKKKKNSPRQHPQQLGPPRRPATRLRLRRARPRRAARPRPLRRQAGLHPVRGPQALRRLAALRRLGPRARVPAVPVGPVGQLQRVEGDGGRGRGRGGAGDPAGGLPQEDEEGGGRRRRRGGGQVEGGEGCGGGRRRREEEEERRGRRRGRRAARHRGRAGARGQGPVQDHGLGGPHGRQGRALDDHEGPGDGLRAVQDLRRRRPGAAARGRERRGGKGQGGRGQIEGREREREICSGFFLSFIHFVTSFLPCCIKFFSVSLFFLLCLSLFPSLSLSLVLSVFLCYSDFKEEEDNVSCLKKDS